MLWLAGIVSPMFLIAAYAFQSDAALRYVFAAVAVIPTIVTMTGFVYFALTNPSRLQSEDYQLRHEGLQILQARVGVVSVDPSSIAAIANPALPSLPGSTEAHQ